MARRPGKRSHHAKLGAGLRTVRDPDGGKYSYRVTGYRNQADEWVSRSPGNGHWYRLVDGRRRPGSAPSLDDLGRSDSINWVTTHTEAPDQPVYFSSDAVSFGAGGTDRVSSDEIMRRQWEYQFEPEPIDQVGRRKRTPKIVQRQAA